LKANDRAVKSDFHEVPIDLENEPLILDTEGQVSIRAGGSTQEKPAPIFLCRCGQSSTKPFCDGTHRRASFEGPAAEFVCP